MTFKETWTEFQTYRRKTKRKMSSIAKKKMLKKLEGYPEEVRIAALERSMENDWQGVFPEKEPSAPPPSPKGGINPELARKLYEEEKAQGRYDR